MSIVIDKRGDYPAKSFRPLATKAWDEFFRIATGEMDLAHWMIAADAATIRLTGRTSSTDESDPNWEPPSPIVVLVDGVIELFEDGMHPSNDELRDDFQRWAVEGILAAFHSSRIAKKFHRFDTMSSRFAIVVSPTDSGLAEDDLEVVWTNDGGLSAADIRARQESAESARKTRPKLKKKRTR